MAAANSAAVQGCRHALTNKEEKYATLVMPSGETRRVCQSSAVQPLVLLVTPITRTVVWVKRVSPVTSDVVPRLVVWR